MLTEEQKKIIEEQFKDFEAMGEYPYCNGILFTLETLGEIEFKEYLVENYYQ